MIRWARELYMPRKRGEKVRPHCRIQRCCQRWEPAGRPHSPTVSVRVEAESKAIPKASPCPTPRAPRQGPRWVDLPPPPGPAIRDITPVSRPVSTKSSHSTSFMTWKVSDSKPPHTHTHTRPGLGDSRSSVRAARRRDRRRLEAHAHTHTALHARSFASRGRAECAQVAIISSATSAHGCARSR